MVNCGLCLYSVYLNCGVCLYSVYILGKRHGNLKLINCAMIFNVAILNETRWAAVSWSQNRLINSCDSSYALLKSCNTLASTQNVLWYSFYVRALQCINLNRITSRLNIVHSLCFEEIWCDHGNACNEFEGSYNVCESSCKAKHFQTQSVECARAPIVKGA